MDPVNYRPISLLNFDHKILTKAMATRLSKHRATIIHPDQAGFVPGRLSLFSVCRLLNILYSDWGKNTQAAVMTLDAQKAFDSIEWPYLFETLRFGFRKIFVNWIEMIYHSPKSSVVTNNTSSEPFTLHRGVRQGHCLSPLLVNTELEPLAIGIRRHPYIEDFPVGTSECLATLYADDVLLTLMNPEVAVSYVLQHIKPFSQISGYTTKVNLRLLEKIQIYKIAQLRLFRITSHI